MHKILTFFIIFASGLILTLFLFFFYNPELAKEENNLISIDEILKNKLSAPMIGDFPAHKVMPGIELKCLGCHAASKKDRQRLFDRFVAEEIHLEGSQIPQIPHEYVENLNCLSCHKHKNFN